MTAFKHLAREAVGDAADLGVQVTNHFIRLPPTEQADDVSINTATEECIGTRRPEGAGIDIGAARNPREGPSKVTALRMTLVRLADVILTDLPVETNAVANGVVGGALCCRK